MKKVILAFFCVVSMSAFPQYLVRQKVDAYSLTINNTPTRIPYVKTGIEGIDFSLAAYGNGVTTVLSAGSCISLEQNLVITKDASKADISVSAIEGKDYFVFRSGVIRYLDNSRYFLNFYELLRRFQTQGGTVFSVLLNEADDLRTYLFEKNGRYLFLKIIGFEGQDISLWMAYK